MIKRGLLLIWLWLFTPVLLAQEAPVTVYQAALRAANAALPGLGEPGSWTFQLLPATSQSHLGCPLVQGAELGRAVTPYRITLVYPTGQYVVHVSTDGTLTQLCDDKFGPVTASTPAPPSGCELSAAADPAVRLAPDVNAAVTGGGVLTNGKAYAIGRNAPGDWLQVRTLNGGMGWIETAQVTVGGDCNSLPVTALPDPDFDGGTCFVTPASAFSNVRQRPSTDNPVVGQIFEGSYWQVFARSTAGDWYYINPGWISLRVVQTYGICDGLPNNDNLVGTGPAFLSPANATPTPPGTPVSTTIAIAPVSLATPLPPEFACPTGYTGFLPPRISRGAANARVSAGDEPNRLRSEPHINAPQVGTAQPGRTLDVVLDGPACSDTFVWWLVEIDGVRGWTAESDAETNRYFLEPPGGAVVNVTPVPTLSISTSPALPTPAGGSPAARAEVALESGGDAEQIVFSADSKRMAAWSALDDIALQMWDITDINAITPLPRLTWEGGSAIVQMAVSPANVLALLTSDKLLRLYDFATLNPMMTVPELDIFSTLDFSPDGRLLLTIACNVADCSQGRIDLRDATNGRILRAQPAHAGGVQGAIFSPDGIRIASWGNDGIQLWDTQSGAFITGITKTPANAPASNVIFSKDGAQVLQAVCMQTGVNNRCTASDIVAFNATSGTEVSRIAAAHPDWIYRMALSPDGQFLATSGLDGVARLWDMTAQQTVLEAAAGAVTFTPDGRFLVTRGAAAGMIAFLEVPAG